MIVIIYNDVIGTVMYRDGFGEKRIMYRLLYAYPMVILRLSIGYPTVMIWSCYRKDSDTVVKMIVKIRLVEHFH